VSQKTRHPIMTIIFPQPIQIFDQNLIFAAENHVTPAMTQF